MKIIMKVVIIATLFLKITGVYTLELPDYLKFCKKGEEGAKCAVDNVNAVRKQLVTGEPKYNLHKISPFHVEKIEVQATQQLKMSFKDVDVYGFDEVVFKTGKIDEKGLNLTFTSNKLVLLGQYSADGQILVLPIKGEGAFNFTLVDLNMKYYGKFFEYQHKGKTYYKVQNDDSSKVTITDLKRMYYRLDNLFNGDPKLGPEINAFINENWQDVYEEVKDALEKIASYAVANYYANGYLKNMPVESLFIP